VEIVDRICEVLDREVPPASNPALSSRGLTAHSALKTFVPDRPGHDRRYAIDATRIREELGWQPAHDFEAGIVETVRWYLSHREWCRNVQAGGYARERLGLSAAPGPSQEKKG
jgi:dTDP-glucose 4,6-dehydratase